ncbi:Spb1 C-terminal domain-containing protein [Gongronella butleri]|nr:Spb1 C-terminal domain-containing protein [Gongronella butleri]
MGKGRDKKSSKGRLDKYYHMAKEQGYRARSAFKLIQLNKKYNFLERSRVLIDLCAAPGGWLQVATKYMPQSSLIVGVDLAAIKPIPNVITFQDDITTDKCRQHLRQELKTWKADVVLHDGAPNVGAAWTHDAFSQSELVLVSLKLATEFLAKGGTFVTKVFRSKDYNKLIWVFQQLFRKVEATKPPSSRGVSAEIFVVCRDFIAPKKIDPRFLDPKAVFSELEGVQDTKMTDIFKPEKKHRQRGGYEDGNYTLHKTADAMEFVKTQDPIGFLATYNAIQWDSDESRELLKHASTTEDVKLNFEDLKVLGKRDFRTLLKWRSGLREEYKLEKKEEKAAMVQVEEEELDEDEKLEAEVEQLSKDEAAKRKRQKRKANEKKMKLIHRMEMNMTVPTDIALDQEGADGYTLFNIRKIAKDAHLDKVQRGDMSAADAVLEDDDDGHHDMDMTAGRLLKDGRFTEHMDAELQDGMIVDKDDYDQELEDQLDEEYERLQQRRMELDPKYRAKVARGEQDEWHGFDQKHAKNGNNDDDISDSSDDDEEDINYSNVPRATAVSSDEESDNDEFDMRDPSAFVHDDTPVPKQKKKAAKGSNSLINDLGHQSALARKTGSGLSMGASMFFDQDIFADIQDGDDDHENDSDDASEIDAASAGRKRKAEEDLDESDFEMEETEEALPSDDEMWSGDEDETSKAMREVQDKALLTAEAMTMARQLVNREKSKQDLIDDGFSREGFRDKDDLPAWFLDDESQHNKPNLPITKEAVQAIREKLKALDARPIKKIAEAKARKKHKTMKRLQRAQKKATDVADNPDMSEKEKVQTINRIISRSTKAKPKKEVKLVVARGSNRGIKGRPQGVKGRYKMVDPRMKKELRAEKRKAKKKGTRRK